MPEYFPLSHEVQAAEPALENVPLTHAAPPPNTAYAWLYQAIRKGVAPTRTTLEEEAQAVRTALLLEHVASGTEAVGARLLGRDADLLAQHRRELGAPQPLARRR